LVHQLSTLLPVTLLANTPAPTRASLDAARARATQVRQRMIAEQEELDWHCYRLYELLPAGISVEDVEHSTPVEVELGERAFEIVLGPSSCCRQGNHQLVRPPRVNTHHRNSGTLARNLSAGRAASH
jgi:hypothetical protein